MFFFIFSVITDKNIYFTRTCGGPSKLVLILPSSFNVNKYYRKKYVDKSSDGNHTCSTRRNRGVHGIIAISSY